MVTWRKDQSRSIVSKNRKKSSKFAVFCFLLNIIQSDRLCWPNYPQVGTKYDDTIWFADVWTLKIIEFIYLLI